MLLHSEAEKNTSRVSASTILKTNRPKTQSVMTHPMYQCELSLRPTDQKHNQLSHISCISVNYPWDQQTKNTISYHTSHVSVSTILETNRQTINTVITHPMYQHQLSLRPTDQKHNQLSHILCIRVNYPWDQQTDQKHNQLSHILCIRVNYPWDQQTDHKHNQLSHIPCISVNYPWDQQTKNTISYHTSRVSVSTILKANRQTKHTVSYCIGINSSKGQGRGRQRVKQNNLFSTDEPHHMGLWQSEQPAATAACRSASFFGGCPDLMGLYMPWPDEVVQTPGLMELCGGEIQDSLAWPCGQGDTTAWSDGAAGMFWGSCNRQPSSSSEPLSCEHGQGMIHTPSIAFRHPPPNSARFSYATEGVLFISAQLSTDAVSALRKFRVLIWL